MNDKAGAVEALGFFIATIRVENEPVYDLLFFFGHAMPLADINLKNQTAKVQLSERVQSNGVVFISFMFFRYDCKLSGFKMP